MSDTPDTPTLPPSPPSTPRPGTSPSAAPPENVVSLSRFRARHARDARQRALDGLLDARSPEAAVRALPGETLHDLVGRGDPREHLDVLVHARPEQIQTVFDLALWSGDRLAPSRIEPWIATLAALPSEVVTRFVAGLDVELVALLIRKGARIYDLEIEAPPDEPQGTFYSTPDGFFVLDVTGYRVESDPAASHGATEAAVGAPDSGEVATPDAASGGSEASADALIHVVDNLYKGDLDFARRILVGAKAELDSELEEMAFRWRQGRLQDLGFEDAAAAREVYRPLDPASVRIGELRPGTRVRPLASAEADGAAGAPPERTRLPAPLEAELEGESVFARARARVTDSAEREELDVALYALANRVLAAAGVDPGDEDAGSAHLARLRATLDLGIDYLARRSGAFDEDRAVDAVRTISIGRIFRVGVSLTAKVRSLATALRKGAPFAGSVDDLNLVEEPEATVLEAALRPHPAFPRILDEPPASGERPIASLADLASLTAAIERAAAAQILLLGLGVTPAAFELATGDGVEPADRAAIDTAVLARTALILALLSRRPGAGAAEGLRPLTPLEIGRFNKVAATPAILSRARTLLEGLAPEAMTRAAREMAARWVGSLAPLEPVLVRRARAPRKAPSRPRTRS
jgi:hypothetical protein